MDTRNLVLAIVASLVIVLGWQFLFPAPKPVPQQQAAQQQGQPGTPGAPSAAPGSAPTAAAPAQPRDRAAALAESARVKIEAPEVTGSIALKGARLDDVRLVKHRQTVDPTSPSVILLSPEGTPDAYFTEHGWSATGVKVPGADTLWTADTELLKPGQPATLSWNNGEGLVFKIRYEIDEHFLFTVTQSVENSGGAAVTLTPYALTTRNGTPKTDGLYILHEGPIGMLNGTLNDDFTYSKLKDAVKDNDPQRKNGLKFGTTGGWGGFTDKYWLVALVPDQQKPVTLTYKYTGNVTSFDRYQVDYLAEAQTVAPGGKAETLNRVYAGAKVVDILESYEETKGITRLDMAVDWGWFFFLTKPMFKVLDWLYRHIGNFGLAIMCLTVLVKLLFFPLANKSYHAMSKMKALTPEMTRLRERYGNDRQKLNQEMMQLYKREKVNPAAGCLPILVQIPVFFALYKTLYVTIEMRHAPFFGWIHDLSAPDPATILTLFGFVHWDIPHLLNFINIGIWPLIMGITMFLQQKLNPAPADPVQAKIFMLMPIMFTFILAPFAAGLVIYWAWNNTLSIAQQYIIMRRMHVKVSGGVDAGAPSPLVGDVKPNSGAKAKARNKAKTKT
ncbi:MAG: rane protein insertase YidC [Alphaproteobacteria bacterium]|nr:rane protein insertase YidC [Alphaproteobacteria bacterium]